MMKGHLTNENAFCGGRRQRENETSGETKELDTISFIPLLTLKIWEPDLPWKIEP